MLLSIAYAALLLVAAWVVKHKAPTGALLYTLSVLPAVPLAGVVLRMAKYLSEETDEYQRAMTVQSLLIGTAALVISLLVNDFLRAFAKADALEPFVGFVIFCGAMAATKGVQWLRDRVPAND